MPEIMWHFHLNSTAVSQCGNQIIVTNSKAEHHGAALINHIHCEKKPCQK